MSKTALTCQHNAVIYLNQTDKLDGLRMNKKKDVGPQRLQDYLQLPDDYESRTSQPGKKRVSIAFANFF